MKSGTTRREFLSITLGEQHDDSKTFRRKTIWRAWRRLSRLQRSVICLVLLLLAICTFYIVPNLLPSSGSASGHSGKQPEMVADLAGKNEERTEKELTEIENKAKADIKNIMAKINRKNSDDYDAGVVPKKIEVGDSLPLPPKDYLKPESNNEDMGQIKPPLDQRAENYFDANRPVTERQRAVVEAFQYAWQFYEKYAWGHDEYHPISKTFNEWFGIGLTIVDSLDTMIIMGLEKEFKKARDWVEKEMKLDNKRDVNLFEITIRGVGGLLSAYHLTKDNIFKEKAKDLGDRLLPCFASGSKVPFSDVNLNTGVAHAPRWGPDSSTSEVTTIQLEFRDLSRVTGDPRYEEAAHAVSAHVHSLPKKDGLVPIFINAQSGMFRSSATITLGARGDSYYEYLLKQWVQTGKTIDMFKDDFIDAVEGIKKNLLSKSVPSGLVYIGELLSGRTFSPKMDHLVCYLPGTLALGHHNGLPAEHMELAEQLANTCFEMYNKMPTKLSPEIVYFNKAPGAPDDLIVKPLDAHNLLRPETVESLFYLYRFTGDKKYQDWGWSIFQAFLRYTKVEGGGFSSIHNVKNPRNPGFNDKLESFFLSETLKYLYLLFSEDKDFISLDKFIFNSEAHPLPIYSS
ncbi:hypothetical protein ScPMuIL_010156 [Solemya velum]